MSFTFENTKPEISDDDLLEDLRRVGSAVGTDGVPTRRTYQREGKYAVVTLQKRFGSWRAAVKAAGFETATRQNISDDELFDNLRQCWMTLGRQPRKREMQPPISQFTHNPYIRRYGSWLNAMRDFCEIVEAVDNGAVTLPDTVAPKGYRDPNLRLRFVVMRRDRFRCVICGSSPATSPDVLLHVDHILAWSKGGGTDLNNLRTLCSRCNLGKSNLAANDHV